MSSRPDLDLSVYLVTDTAMCGGPDGVVATVRAAVAHGATVVQLRDHDLGDDDFVTLGRRLVEAVAPHGVPLLVDDRVDLVSAIGAAGAHVGQSDMPVRRAREILGPDALLGLSLQDPSGVEAVRRLGPGVVDYLGVGALRSTGTKPGAAALGPVGIREVVVASPWPVCAIGGVVADDAEDLARLGCQGMAVVSAICAADDPASATATLAEAWRRARGRA